MQHPEGSVSTKLWQHLACCDPQSPDFNVDFVPERACFRIPKEHFSELVETSPGKRSRLNQKDPRELSVVSGVRKAMPTSPKCGRHDSLDMNNKAIVSRDTASVEDPLVHNDSRKSNCSNSSTSCICLGLFLLPLAVVLVRDIRSR